ncbi:response regulator [Tahibacter amnicola]|uniref:Response regulator n=1 Tax=Tahibacter amnicola TaxID=2976241 RepID=A0ABY6BDP1_9GAMM|nr:response regulator [Tahibacter amnicola]UXI68148.1 response regulator [Tahibacter amnicola]
MPEKPTIVCIDDEERIVRSLNILLKTAYNVIATTNPREVLDVVKRERVHVVVSDQRMPEVTGVDLLREVRAISPLTMRVLLTGYSDLAAIVGSINDGEIFRFISKPWDADEFRKTIDQAASIANELFEQSRHPVAVATDNKAPNADLLVIDDSEEVFKLIEGALGRRVRVHWANNLDAAFEIIEREKVGVVVSDVKLGGADITLALKTLKRHAPHLVTVVLAWFHDTKQLIELINQAQIYRFLPKPVRPHMLETAVDSAMARYRQLSASPVLAKAHVVESSGAEETTGSFSSRVVSFFQRIRERARA